MAFPSHLPTARTPDPLRAPPLRWGIVGPGWIAERLVRSLKENTKQEVAAVAGSPRAKAQASADRRGIRKAFAMTNGRSEHAQAGIRKDLRR